MSLNLHRKTGISLNINHAPSSLIFLCFAEYYPCNYRRNSRNLVVSTGRRKRLLFFRRPGKHEKVPLSPLIIQITDFPPLYFVFIAAQYHSRLYLLPTPIYITSSRALTTSFGSICFGSLLVAIIQTLKQLARNAREQGGSMALLACIAECILGCLESLLQYFNKWAFIYVGLYGFSYLESGKKVIELFKARGWDTIIADELISMALTMLSVLCGLISGAFGLFLEDQTSWFDDIDNSQLISML